MSKRARRRRSGRRRERKAAELVERLRRTVAVFAEDLQVESRRTRRALEGRDELERQLEDNPVFRVMVDRQWGDGRGEMFAVQVLLRPDEFSMCALRGGGDPFHNVSRYADEVGIRLQRQVTEALVKHMGRERTPV